jgi:predicted nucleic acid-binding protein
LEEAADRRARVVCDTCILVNFARIARLDLLVEHPDYRFVVPDQVLDELTEPGQRVYVDAAIASGGLELVVSSDLAEITKAVELRRHMDRGEAVAFAVAEHRGWRIATDEGRRTRRMIVEQLGATRLLTTPAIILQCIRAGVLTVADADAIKAELERHRFRMGFASFADLIGTSGFGPDTAARRDREQ